jgi:hypothetical protein
MQNTKRSYSLLERFGYLLARYLQKESSSYKPISVVSSHRLKDCLLPGDILLVEGSLRVSVAIKYLTQSTWSHAAIYIGDKIDPENAPDQKCLIEADMVDGVVAVPLSKYASSNTRICRPVHLRPEDSVKLIENVVSKLGEQYDMKSAIDLFRYLLPQPPVPVRWRRKMLALGHGDPTRAICSTLIADAFHAIQYPILPDIADHPADAENTKDATKEIRHIYKTDLFAPRDFDLSPYFRVIKPALAKDFDYRTFKWVQ